MYFNSEDRLVYLDVLCYVYILNIQMDELGNCVCHWRWFAIKRKIIASGRQSCLSSTKLDISTLTAVVNLDAADGVYNLLCCVYLRVRERVLSVRYIAPFSGCGNYIMFRTLYNLQLILVF